MLVQEKIDKALDILDSGKSVAAFDLVREQMTLIRKEDNTILVYIPGEGWLNNPYKWELYDLQNIFGAQSNAIANYW